MALDISRSVQQLGNRKDFNFLAIDLRKIQEAINQLTSASAAATPTPVATPTSQIITAAPVLAPSTTINGMSGAVAITGSGIATQPASKNIIVTQNAGGVLVQTVNYTAQSSDSGKLLPFNSASAIAYTLPSTAFPNGWWVAVQCVGAGTLTVNPNGLNLDGSGSSPTVVTGKGMLIFSDGSNYWSCRGGS